jgi:LPS-assembly protein
VSYNMHPFSVGYRFRLDRETFKTRRDELDAYYSGSYFALSGNYIRFDEDPIAGSSEEINGGVNVMITPEWSTSFATRRDLKLDQLTTASSGLTYQDECFTFILQASRDLASDRDLKDSTSFIAQVIFKNLE